MKSLVIFNRLRERSSPPLAPTRIILVVCEDFWKSSVFIPSNHIGIAVP